AIKDFLAHAYQAWPGPAPRYVLLLGDASYDAKDFLKAGAWDLVPSPVVRTTYLWTASDLAYAATNGDDLLPDLAIGRLPARTADEVRVLVEKIAAFETAARGLGGRAVFVADGADAAGAFEADSDEVATLAAGREVEKIYLSERGAFTPPAPPA